jgi:hypothetical protein
MPQTLVAMTHRCQPVGITNQRGGRLANSRTSARTFADAGTDLGVIREPAGHADIPAPPRSTPPSTTPASSTS